eukprot:13004-Rhodomonas_salina.1
MAVAISIRDQPFSVQLYVPDYPCTRPTQLVINESLENKEELKRKFTEANARLRLFHKIFMWIPPIILVAIIFVILWAGGVFKNQITKGGLRCGEKQYLSCRFQAAACRLHSDCPNEQGCIWKTADCAGDPTALDKSNDWLVGIYDELCTCEEGWHPGILGAVVAAYLVVTTAAYFAYTFLIGYTVWGQSWLRSWVGIHLPLEATWEVEKDGGEDFWTTARSTITFKGARILSESKRHLFEQVTLGKWVPMPSLRTMFKTGSGRAGSGSGSATSGSGKGKSLRGAAEAAKKQLLEKNTNEPKILSSAANGQNLSPKVPLTEGMSVTPASVVLEPITSTGFHPGPPEEELASLGRGTLAAGERVASSDEEEWLHGLDLGEQGRQEEGAV